MPATDAPADLAMQQMAATATQIPLTPEMTAIQSVVPTPRPASPPSPSTQLAFAATTPQSGALAAIASVGATQRSMSDFTLRRVRPDGSASRAADVQRQRRRHRSHRRKELYQQADQQIFEALRSSRNADPSRRSSRKPLQSEGLQQARLFRPDADQVQYGEIDGL